MRIGIFTFHSAINYGAILQAYGMQEYLKSINNEACIINYCPQYIKHQYKLFTFYHKKGVFQKIKWLAWELIVWPIRLKRRIIFRNFRQKYLNIEQIDYNYQCDNFDAFIFGSDQIWNPNLTSGLDNIFLGKFPASAGKRLIAYAASVGSITNIAHIKTDLVSALKDASFHISVREQSLADYLSREISRYIPIVVDPVILAGRDIYDVLIKESTIKTPCSNYILIFSVRKNPRIYTIAKYIAAKYNYQIVEICASYESLNFRAKQQALSPEGFLKYLQDASYIVTTSFHGTAFSILFNKQFYTIGVDDATNDRARCLLAQFNLEDRLLDRGQMPSCNDIQYSNINEKIKVLRIKSQDFIIEGLASIS